MLLLISSKVIFLKCFKLCVKGNTRFILVINQDLFIYDKEKLILSLLVQLLEERSEERVQEEREQEESESESAAGATASGAPNMPSPSKAKEALKNAIHIKQEPIDFTEEEEEEEEEDDAETEISKSREVRSISVVKDCGGGG